MNLTWIIAAAIRLRNKRRDALRFPALPALLGQEVDNLPLALIAPLGAHYHYIRQTCPLFYLKPVLFNHKAREKQ